MLSPLGCHGGGFLLTDHGCLKGGSKSAFVVIFERVRGCLGLFRDCLACFLPGLMIG